MPRLAVKTPQYLGCSVASATMVRRVAREAWRHDQRGVARIGIGLWVAVRIPCMDRGLRAPEVVVIFIEERRHQAVVDRHVDQRQSLGIFRQRMLLCRGNLPGSLVEHCGWRRHRVESRDIGAIRRPLFASNVTECHDLVVGFRVLVARKHRRWLKKKLINSRDAERSDILPVEKNSDSHAIYDWTTRCGLPFTWNSWPRNLELRHQGAVVRTQSNHGQSCGFTRGDAIVLGLAVRYLCERVRALETQHRGVGWEIGHKHPVCSLNRCCVGGGPWGCCYAPEIGLVVTLDGVHRFKHCQLHDRRMAGSRDRGFARTDDVHCNS